MGVLGGGFAGGHLSLNGLDLQTQQQKANLVYADLVLSNLVHADPVQTNPVHAVRCDQLGDSAILCFGGRTP